jgi:RNA recognition motif-containing protein
MVIYVGNLHYDVREDVLSDLFAEFGEVVSTRVVIDRETNRSKGFGFVENAINALGGKEVNGRALKISKANPPAPKGQRSGGGGYGGGNRGPRSFGGDRGGNGGGGYRGGNDRGGYGGGDRGNDRGGYGNDRGNDRGGYNRGGGDRDYNNDNY